MRSAEMAYLELLDSRISVKDVREVLGTLSKGNCREFVMLARKRAKTGHRVWEGRELYYSSGLSMGITESFEGS